MNNEFFETKKISYKEKIDKIPKESFNEVQKQLSKEIIDLSSEHNIDAIYQLIAQRIKTGFVFDIAPEVNHNAISIIQENESLYIKSKANPLTFLEHKLIIGENYDALKNLLVSYTDPKSGKGLIDIVYIDPPYHTESAKIDGNDYKEEVEASKFVYRDKFTRDGWLNMLNERLRLAKKLLKDNGVIYISIDDNEQAYLKVLCDEIFGEDNFISCLPRVTKKSGKQHSENIGKNHDYILIYAKEYNTSIIRKFDSVDDGYQFEDEFLNSRGKYKLNQTLDYDSLFYNKTMDFKLEIDGETFVPGGDVSKQIERHNGIFNKMDWVWRWSKAKFEFGLANGFIVIKKNGERPRIYTKTYANATIDKLNGNYYVKEKVREKVVTSLEFVENVYSNDNGKKDLTAILGKNVFEYTKPVELIKKLIQIYNNDDALVLDFYAGSGTTGQAVMELNEEDGGARKFILVTNNESNIAYDVTRERLFRVINGVGTKEEKIDWEYSNTLTSLVDNQIRVFELVQHDLKLNDFEKAKRIIPLAEKQFELLNERYKARDKFDIYNELSSLNPYKKD